MTTVDVAKLRDLAQRIQDLRRTVADTADRVTLASYTGSVEDALAPHDEIMNASGRCRNMLDEVSRQLDDMAKLTNELADATEETDKDAAEKIAK